MTRSHLFRKFHSLALGAVLILAAATCVSSIEVHASNGTTSGNVEKDITYAVIDSAVLKMDIYYPGSITGLAPAVVFVHGGALVYGNRSYMAGLQYSRELLERGYLVASIDYRLAPRYRWPAQIEDTKCAIRYLRANANKYRLDPNRIGALGPSAGGHLVAMLGITNSSVGFDNSGGYFDQSSRVQAAVDMYGTTELATAGANVTKDFNAWFGTPNPSEETLRKASPITYVTGDSAPFLILHGELDDMVPPSQSRVFYERLRAVGVTATLVMVKNAGHGFRQVGGPVSPSEQEITRMVADFFDKHVKGLPASTTTATATRSSQLTTITTASATLATSMIPNFATNLLESYGVYIGMAIAVAALIPLLVRRNRKGKS
jgi:acetyl esterase/lipase